MTVSLTVTNAGTDAGDEVVQLYLRQDSTTARGPIAELKGFRRIAFQPGQSETVSFTLTGEHLARYDGSPGLAVCPGSVQVMCGNSSKHLPLTGAFKILS